MGALIDTPRLYFYRTFCLNIWSYFFKCYQFDYKDIVYLLFPDSFAIRPYRLSLLTGLSDGTQVPTSNGQSRESHSVGRTVKSFGEQPASGWRETRGQWPTADTSWEPLDKETKALGPWFRINTVQKIWVNISVLR